MPFMFNPMSGFMSITYLAVRSEIKLFNLETLTHGLLKICLANIKGKTAIDASALGAIRE